MPCMCRFNDGRGDAVADNYWIFDIAANDASPAIDGTAIPRWSDIECVSINPLHRPQIIFLTPFQKCKHQVISSPSIP